MSTVITDAKARAEELRREIAAAHEREMQLRVELARLRAKYGLCDPKALFGAFATDVEVTKEMIDACLFRSRPFPEELADS